MRQTTLLLALLFAVSIATLLGAIFDDGNRAIFSISTIVAHTLLIAVGYVAARRRYER
jgi:uncharacterized membrane protein YqjE